jgi:hypothetical protein
MPAMMTKNKLKISAQEWHPPMPIEELFKQLCMLG